MNKEFKDHKVINDEKMKQNWEIKKLGEVFDLQMGKTPSRDNSEYWGGSNVWIAISDLQNKYIGDSKEYITDTALTETKIKKVKAGTTIMSFKLSVGRAAITTKDLYTNEAIMAFNLNEGYNLIVDYIYYYLKGCKWQGANKAVMGLTLNKASISQNPIPIPPLPIQEKIVAELDCLRGVIEKKKEQLKELDALAQSIFYTMFGDPITNEKGWEVKKVIDVVKMQRGFDLPIQDRDNNGVIPIYGSNGIIGYHSIHKAEFGIITGRSGTLGEVYSSNTPFWPLNTTLFSIDTHGNNIVYLKYLIIYFHLERFKAGAGVPTLNRNEFHNEPIPNIPLTLQQEFAAKVEAIEKQKGLIKESIKEVEDLFNARMQYYFG